MTDLDCENCVGLSAWLPVRAEKRLHEGHLAVRFGDQRFTVYLDGQTTTNCLELIMDRDGTGEALCYVEPLEMCGSSKHARREIRRGRFRVAELTPPAPDR